MKRHVAFVVTAAIVIVYALCPEYAKANAILPGATASVFAGASYTMCCKGGYLYFGADKAKSLSYPSSKAKSLPLNVNTSVAVAGGAANVGAGADPTISTSASMVLSPDYGGWGESGSGAAALSYSIEIVGPGSGYVPVDISAQYSVKCPYSVYSGFGFTVCSTASLAVGVGGGTSNFEPVGFYINDNGTATLPFGTGTYHTTADLKIGTPIAVGMTASSAVNCDGQYVDCWDGQSFGTSAMVDPLFSVDASVPNADQYKVLVSADLTTTQNPVPEPASIFLIGSALAGLGLARRRRIVT